MTKRLIPSFAASALLAGALLIPGGAARADVGWGDPDSCAATPMSTLADLRNAITNATDGDPSVVYLGAAAALVADGSGIDIAPGSSITIDLCGGSVTISSSSTAVHVPTGASLTITDSIGAGTLSAETTGGYQGAAIGGGVREGAGAITIDGGSVTARTHTFSGAAIGGGYGGHGGTTTGSTPAPAGGTGGSGGVVTVNGGSLTAVAAEVYSGAAIGGGFGGMGGTNIDDFSLDGVGGEGGAGGTLIINGGTVTAIGGSGVYGSTAIGGGSGGFGRADGASGAGADIVMNGGTLNAEGYYLPIGSGSTAGTVDGAPGTIEIAGDWIAGVTPVELPRGGSVDAGHVPAITPSGGPQRFVVANGTSGGSVTTRIEFVDALLDVTPSSSTAEVGDTITVNGTAHVPSGATFDVSSALLLSSSVAEDVVSGNTVTFPHASPHVITASYGGISTTFTIEVSSLSLAATGTEQAHWPLGAIAMVMLGALFVISARRRARRA